MKLPLLFILFVTVYIVLNAELSLQQKVVPKSNSRMLLRFQRQRQLSNLLRVPQIICSYAKYGRWPEFDTRLRPLVLQFSRTVFAMNDESIKLYCTQVFRFNQFYRPQGRPREFTLPPVTGTRSTIPPRNYFTFRMTPFTPFLFQPTPSFRSLTSPPVTTTQSSFFVQTATAPPTFATVPTTAQRPFFVQTFAPVPTLPVVTIPTTTRNIILPDVTTTTTTVAPSSGSASSGSGKLCGMSRILIKINF